MLRWPRVPACVTVLQAFTHGLRRCIKKKTILVNEISYYKCSLTAGLPWQHGRVCKDPVHSAELRAASSRLPGTLQARPLLLHLCEWGEWTAYLSACSAEPSARHRVGLGCELCRAGTPFDNKGSRNRQEPALGGTVSHPGGLRTAPGTQVALPVALGPAWEP